MVRKTSRQALMLFAVLLTLGTVSVAGRLPVQQAVLTLAEADLENGILAFRAGEYANAKTLLVGALSGGLPRRDISRAREFLALSLYYLREEARSVEQLRLLYSEDRGYKASSPLPSELAALFDGAKKSADELSDLNSKLTEAVEAAAAAKKEKQEMEAALESLKATSQNDAKRLAQDLETAKTSASDEAVRERAETMRRQRATLSALLDINWRKIEPKAFQMGCSKDVQGRYDEDCSEIEKPQETIALAPFELMVTEVTIGMFKLYAKAPGAAKLPIQKDPKKDRHPVVNVQPNDARAFCDWLHARLPTEAEWEYAARDGGKIPRYPWGAKFDSARANNGYELEETGQPLHRNNLGLYDMLGNVWELTSSKYQAYPYKADGSFEPMDNQGPLVIRGGSWGAGDKLLRVSARQIVLGTGDPKTAGIGLDRVGFRCAVSTP